MKRKALALFSGGLDSILVVKLMQAQGIDVEAVNFTSPFFLCKNPTAGCPSEAVRVAGELGVPIKVIELSVDFLEMIRAPRHGYGSGMNPCIDCRIFFLRKAAEYMSECGADFIVTGEVLGQRPLSQRKEAMLLVERESGLKGLLLRPLSAKFLAPTVPEQEGWVDRERLPAISGRSRKEQMRLASEMGIEGYPIPAGGCLLTEPSFLSKIRDVFDHADTLNMRDFALLRTGRHFRIGARTKVIIGRNEAENETLESIVRPGDATLRWLGGGSPLCVVTGEIRSDLLEIAARILLRYTKAASGSECSIAAVVDGTESRLAVVHEFDEGRIERFRV
jgi:tRNA U34 2-thiouridine synthase MnmA/TrmU